MQGFFHVFRNRTTRLLFLLIGILAITSAVVFFFGAEEPYAEARALSGRFMNFSELSEYFQDLAREKGAPYAFEILRRADLPPNTDLHLLGHVVGDELYAQEGVSGIERCTHDFRNACSHALVIGSLLEYGDGVLPKVADACHQAPGGKGAYTMCYHGFGHGVLAYNGYDFPDTVAFCKRTGTDAYQGREYIECVGGAVMEILGGGGHDRDKWLTKREEYLSPTNPLSLCQASFMPEEARPICYTYLTPHLFTFTGNDLGSLTEADFRRSFSYCDAIPQEQAQERDACFGGLGKEFIALVWNWDIRNIEATSNEQLRTIDRWCSLAGDDEAASACVVEAVTSLFWGGENDRRVAIRFCSLVSNPRAHADCFTGLTNAVDQYIDNEAYREAFCSEIQLPYQAECRDRLL